MFSDLRYGLRTLVQNPGFTIVAALVLALGIGANTAIFSMLKGVLLWPLPGVPASGDLVMVLQMSKEARAITLSHPDYRDFRDRSQSFSGLIAASPAPLTLNSEGENRRPERIWGELVSGNYFSVLGVKAIRGRTLTPDDDRLPGAHPVAVVSHGLWQRRFGRDPGLVGKTIRLNGHPFTVVGVASPGFAGSMVGLSLDVFVPTMMQPQVMTMGMGDWLNSRGTNWLFALGRLRPGVNLQQAQAELRTLSARMDQERTAANLIYTVTVFPLARAPFGTQKEIGPALILLMAVVGVVLLVACANLTSLLLARAVARRREMAIRLALGASRIRLVRQLLTESLLLAWMGGTIGALLSLWLVDLMDAFAPPTSLPLALDEGFDYRVLVFTALLSVFTTLLFGLVPAFQASRPDLVPALKEETPGGGSRRLWLRNALVVGQLALSLVALICGGLLLRGLRHARRIDPGFNPNNVLLASFDLQPLRYSESQAKNFYRQLLDRVGALPGVKSASIAALIPLSYEADRSFGVSVPGYTPRRHEDMSIRYNVVGPGYFETMGMTLVRGREITRDDHEKSRPVIIINEAMARRFWPGQDALGRTFRTAGRAREVVGIAKDGKYLSLRDTGLPFMYFPAFQLYQPMMTLHVRTAGDPLNLASAVQKEIESMHPDLAAYDVRSLSNHMGISTVGERMASTMLGAFGMLALLLATVGLYGVMAYSVSRRTREIGVRMALGASRADVLRMIARQGLILILVGVAVGTAMALAATRALTRFLYGVSPSDPLTFAAIPLLLGATALLACYLPARRAAKVDPMVALRYE